MQTVSAAATIFNGHGPAVHVQERRLLYGKIQQIKLPVSHTKEDLENKIKKALKNLLGRFTFMDNSAPVLRCKEKPELFFVYTVEAEVKKRKTGSKKR